MTTSDTANYNKIFLEKLPLMDVRAPTEFKKGAFPNTINLPLMNDEERQQVGIRYKQAGQEAAIKLGRKLLTPALQKQRTQNWLDFAHLHPGGYIYCFRGGLRSRITQQLLAEAGVDYPYIVGGYKAMRRYLIDKLDQNVEQTALIILNGRTGTGKTVLLRKISRMIDLEGLAKHRGSSFGKLLVQQPEPIDFENRLSISMLNLCHASHAPIFVEGEGRLIGRVCLPESFWKKMAASPCVVLESSLQERIQIAVQDYVVDILQRLKQNLNFDEAFEQLAERHYISLYNIRKRLGGDRYKKAYQLLESALSIHRNHGNLSKYEPFIKLLLTEYYDPMYDYQLQKRSTDILFKGEAQAILEWSEHRLAV